MNQLIMRHVISFFHSTTIHGYSIKKIIIASYINRSPDRLLEFMCWRFTGAMQ
jgi:hypothetical protein